MSSGFTQSVESPREKVVAVLGTGIPRTAAALATELGWRATSVRGLISRMRREGVPIESRQSRRNLPAVYSMQTTKERAFSGSLDDALAALRSMTDREFESVIASLRVQRELGIAVDASGSGKATIERRPERWSDSATGRSLHSPPIRRQGSRGLTT